MSEATKKALSQGDYETAARSLYNEGILHSEEKKLPEAYDRLTKAIEVAKISNLQEIEKKAREALTTLIEKQKQQSKSDKDKKDEKDKKDKDSQGKDPKDQKDKGDQKKDSEPNDQQKQDQKDPKQMENGKRQFKSGTLSKDVAESIMNDLSDREKQLYQKRMKEHKPREVPNDKDW